MPTDRFMYNFAARGGYSPYQPAPGNGRLIDIIMRGGAQQAQAARDQGEIWANAVSQAGQTIAGGLEKAATESKLKKRDEAWVNALNSPDFWKDPASAYKQVQGIFGPGKDADDKFKLALSIHQMSQPKRDPEMDKQALGIAARQYMDSGPAMRAMVYPQLRGLAINSNPQLAQFLPEQHSLEADQSIIAPAVEQLAPKKAQRSTKVVGETLVDDQTGEALYTAPQKPTKGPTLGSFEDYVARTYGDKATPDQILEARKKYGQADDKAPRITVSAGGSGLTPTAESGLVTRLSAQWDKAAKNTRELERQAGIMDVGLNAARKGDMAQGSQAVLVTIQKILDPESVVRESEYARSASGLAALSQLKGAYERITKGGAGVPLAELERYATMANQIVAQSKKSLEGRRKRIGAQADRYKLPHELIFDDEGSAPAGGDNDPMGLR